jgi:rfaE bifunctional protein nucleotidyltransferase chain/domain
MSFISSWIEARNFIEDLQKKGRQNIVTTNGCFDILHAGHCLYLQKARDLGDCLIVGINSDESVKKIKGPSRPVNDQNSRALVLKHLKMVDLVCVFDEETPNAWLSSLRPSIHTKGGDWDPKKMPENQVLSQWGARIVCLPYVSGFSTTSTIEKMRQ